MTDSKTIKNYTLDAAKLTAGRLAAQAAKILQGKNLPDWQAHLDAKNFVKIINIGQLHFTGKKLKQKNYYRVSQYLGGLKTELLETKLAKNPAKLFQIIVKGMLPNNKLRTPRLKRIIIK